MEEQAAWQPISLEQLEDEVRNAECRMNAVQRRLWDAAKVTPEKWRQEPYGNEGGGFWVVALFGGTVIWFNDIEDGFNHSHYSRYGVIDEYWCNQDDLEQSLQWLVNLAIGRT